MLSLQLLGGLSLLDEGGPIPGPVSQRRRLALLARVAAAPQATLSRDRLIAAFWAEEDRERARHFLADSLFTLRKGLGKDTVLSVGDDVSLNPQLFSCDLWRFRALLEQGAPEEAVALYQGPFLDGFFVSDAAGFERWVEEERSRVANGFAGALERLAVEAEGRGDHSGAARWWKRLAAHDPFSSRVALRLMRSLATAGDRAEAVRHARVHAVLLREELELEADPQVEALAAEIAAGGLAAPDAVGAAGDAVPAGSGGSGRGGGGARQTISGAPTTDPELDPPAPSAAAAGVAERGADAEPAAATPVVADPLPGRGTAARPDAAAPRRPASPPPPWRRARRRYRTVRRLGVVATLLVLVALLGTMAMWGRVRQGAFAGSAPDRGGTPPGQRVLVVLPFEYEGSDDFAFLADGMVTLLSSALDGAGSLRTVDPYAVLSRTSAAREGALSLERAGEAAADLGGERFIVGTAVETGGQVQLHAAVYRHGPRPVEEARATVTGTPGFALTHDLARQLLVAELGDEAGQLARRAIEATSSTTALREYLLGEEQFRATRYPAAVEALQRAVRADPSFALAYYRLSMAQEWSFRFTEARQSAAEALQLSSRLSPRDQRLVLAWHEFVHGNAAAAEQEYEALLAEDAHDVEALSGLGEVRLHFGPSRGRPVQEAVHPLEEVLRLAPDFGEARFHLLELAARQGDSVRFDRLLAEVDPASPQRLSWELARAFSWGEGERAAELVARLERADAVVAGIAAVRAAAHFRDLAGGQALANFLTTPTRTGAWPAAGRIMKAQGYLAQGRTAQALAELEAAAPLEPDWALEIAALAPLLPGQDVPREEVERLRDELDAWDPGARNSVAAFFFATHADAHAPIRRYLLSLLSLHLGDDAAAAEHSEALRVAGGSTTAGQLARALALSAEGHRAAARGDADGALALLEAAELRAPLERITLSPFFSQGLDRFLRAELLRSRGEHDEALRWYATLTDGPDLLWWHAAHTRQAELYELRGDTAVAEQHRAAARRLRPGP